MRLRLSVALALTVAAAACSSQPDVETVQVGTEVQIVREDGGVVTGKLIGRDDTGVQVDVGRQTREVPRAQIADVQIVEPSKQGVLLDSYVGERRAETRRSEHGGGFLRNLLVRCSLGLGEARQL